MNIKEQILEHQITHGVFDNVEFSGTKGIAKRAVSEGFDSLSDKQKAVLEPYLSSTCSGTTDPGGHHNDCSVELTGDALLESYQRTVDTECLVCDSCNSDQGYYTHQWDRISQE
jgi:hypothetical protein